MSRRLLELVNGRPRRIIASPTSYLTFAEAAHRVHAFSDTIEYLESWRDHDRAMLRGELERLGQKSSTKLAPGYKIELVDIHAVICGCHRIDVSACPQALDGQPSTLESVVTGQYLAVKASVPMTRIRHEPPGTWPFSTSTIQPSRTRKSAA
jgi:hypothetical protein